MTTYYHPATGAYVAKYNPFTLNEIQYPSNWLELVSPQEIAALGLVEVVTVGSPEDQRYFWVSETLEGSVRTIVNTPKDAAMVMEIKVAEYTAALEAHYDKKAKERRYDSRYTCSIRAGYVGPFQAEGIAFAQWMDACNAMCYVMLAGVANGDPMPTIAEVIAGLPELTWP
jgi:hypothetical protein